MLKQLSVYQSSVLCRNLTPNWFGVKRERHKYMGKKQKQFDKVIYQYQNVPQQPHDDFEPGEFSPRRLTYAPEYLVKQYSAKKIRPEWWIRKARLKEPTHNSVPALWQESEYRDEAVYPEIIKDESVAPFSKTSLRTRLEWYKKIKSIPSVDGKNYEMTPIPRTCVRLNASYKNHGELKLFQRLTRTHLIRDQLPERYSIQNGVDKSIVDQIKPYFLDSIRFHKHSGTFHTYGRRRRTPKAVFSNRSTHQLVTSEDDLLCELNSILFNAMVSKYPHLENTETVRDDDITSWWYADQLPKPFELKHWKVQNFEKIDQICLYDGFTPVQIRGPNPLSRLVDEDDNLCDNSNVPSCEVHPYIRRYQMKVQYPTCTPGIWPDLNDDHTKKEPFDFPYMSVFGRSDLKTRLLIHKVTNPEDDHDVLTGKAIIGSFGWLNGLANLHGFTPFHEVTYPFVNQGWISDGQNYIFFAYQMNRHTFHSDLFNNDKCNVCWVSPEMKLYENYENGVFHGLNDDVLRQLVKMYTIVPRKEEELIYRPYLGEDLRTEEEKKTMRFFLRRRAGNLHEKEMLHWRNVRKKPFFWKMFMTNPDYDTTLWRTQIIPRLKPAEPYYMNWKY